MTPSILTLLIAGFVLVPVSDRAAADDEQGARIATLCASCHRPDGRNTGIPSITRWEADELVDKMVAFRANERANPVMRAVSLSLSDDEISAVAAYVATQGKRARWP